MGNPIRGDGSKKNAPVLPSDSPNGSQASTSSLNLPSIARVGNTKHEPNSLSAPTFPSRNTLLGVADGKEIKREVDPSHGYEEILKNEARLRGGAAEKVTAPLEQPKKSWFKKFWAKKEETPQTPVSSAAKKVKPEIKSSIPFNIRRVTSNESLASRTRSAVNKYYHGDVRAMQTPPRLFKAVIHKVPQENATDSKGEKADLPLSDPTNITTQPAAIDSSSSASQTSARRVSIVMPPDVPKAQTDQAEGKSGVIGRQSSQTSEQVVQAGASYQAAKDQSSVQGAAGIPIAAERDDKSLSSSVGEANTPKKLPPFIKTNLFNSFYLTKKLRLDDGAYKVYISSSKTELNKALNREKEKALSPNRFVWKTRDLFRKKVQNLCSGGESDGPSVKDLRQDNEYKFQAFANLILQTPDWIKQQGIFREAAEKVKVEQVLEKINGIDLNEVVILKRPTANDISSITKALLGQALTEKIKSELASYIDSDAFKALKDDIDNSSEKALILKNGVSVPGFNSLPQVIKSMAKFLAMVSYYETENNMSSTNLAKIFSVNLISEASLQNAMKNNQLNLVMNDYISFVFALIEHQKRVIILKEEK